MAASSDYTVPKVSYHLNGFGIGCSLLMMAGVLWLLYRRSARERIELGNNVTESAELADSTSARSVTFTSDEIDLQLLRELGDDTPAGLNREIERYLAAFDADRQLARALVGSGDHKRIHQIGHRLLGHSGAVHYQPLMDLAGIIQSEAAVLDSAGLDRLLRDFDREFVALRNKLDALRASTARE
jgi:hypothetical protein